MQAILTQAFVYLFAAVVSVPIAKRLGMGSVLGYLASGIIIGPFALGIVGQEHADVMHFAEFGVVMMLFLIGLELQPQLLWSMRKPIFVNGGIQVGVTSAILWPLIVYGFGASWQEGLALSLILALSSTAMVLQTLSEKNLLNTGTGQTSFCILLFQDLAVIPLLSILPLLAVTTGGSSGGHDGHHGTTLIADLHPGLQTLVILLTLAGIIAAGRYLARPIFRIVAGVGMREIFTAFALMIVVGIALLMQQIGISAALGTFLAGVVLANSEYRHELESVIDPFKGILLAVFFIAVGASIDFNIIIGQPIAIAAGVGGLVLIKALVLYGIGQGIKMNLADRFFVATLLSQGGEFAFVLITFCITNSILGVELANLFVAIVTISMLTTPLLLILYDRFGGLLVKDSSREQRPPDTIDKVGRVIICGYGRVGQIVARILHANNVETILLDHNPNQIEMVRRFGIKVFYGDATRVELLESAGAKDADLIVVAVDDHSQCMEIVENCKKHFPKVRIVARARGRREGFDLINKGCVGVFRETFHSSLAMATEAMALLGFRRHQAHRIASRFAAYDNQAMRELAKHQGDRESEEYLALARRQVDDILNVIRSDQNQVYLQQDGAWDGPPVRLNEASDSKGP